MVRPFTLRCQNRRKHSMARLFKNILLAEDDERDIELTLKALDKYNLANNVEVTRDGQEVLDYLFYHDKFRNRGKGNPIVLLLDLKMPKVDGLEVLRKIKSDKDLKSMPVVILTSSREEGDLLESYKLGTNAYVVKPVNFKQLTDAIRALGLFWAVVNEPPPRSMQKANHQRYMKDKEQ